MPTHATVLVFAGVLTALVGPTSNVEAQDDAAEPRRMSETSNGVPVHSSGEYDGKKWHIDDNHLMYWDGEPYVRFGFTGNGDVAQMVKAGFHEFTLCPTRAGPFRGLIRSMFKAPLIPPTGWKEMGPPTTAH